MIGDTFIVTACSRSFNETVPLSNMEWRLEVSGFLSCEESICRIDLQSVDCLSREECRDLGLTLGLMPAALTAKKSEMREVDMAWDDTSF